MFDIRKIQEKVLHDAVKAESNEAVALEIVGNHFETNPEWVSNSMKRLEDRFDKPAVKKIRMNCQCGYGMDEKLALLKELVQKSSDLEEFASHDEAKAAGISFCDGELYLQFPFCPCPMLAETVKLESNSWCLCTTGYSKVVFGKAFGCEVEVELLKSIKMGDDFCLQKIKPLGAIRF